MPIKTFLSEVVEDVLQSKPDLSQLLFILPSKRAGVFLLNELKKQITQTAFAPKIISIEEFVSSLSGLTTISNTQLLFEFYSVYLELTESETQENFESFSKWAQILLQDFNEIDRYLINPKEILGHLGNIQELTHWSLQADQTDLVKNYIAFWGNLYAYYNRLTEKLIANKNAYQGLVYKEAVTHLKTYSATSKQEHIFVGFNALNTAEQHLIQQLLDAKQGRIYWDTDVAFTADSLHGASLFINSYRKKWPHYNTHPFNWIRDNFSAEKNIQCIGTPKNIAQVKQLGSIIKTLSKTKHGLQNTAIVLGDESLLLPTLNSLPNTISGINITMGFPLKNTPMASLFEHLFEMHKKPNLNKLYHQDVIALLSHQNIRPLFYLNKTDFAQHLIDYIQEKNSIYIAVKELIDMVPSSIKKAVGLLFNSWENKAVLALDNLTELIHLLQKQLQILPEKNALPLEYLYRFHQLFNQLSDYNKTYPYVTNVQVLYSVYRELITYETLDFQGEPLEGLQLMGVLESRVLDFETVIISSVNEGVFPSGKSNNSFLPIDLKVAYKLPTYTEKDAIYTYHFYRLLQRAKNIYILYNTEPDALNGGERSRFLSQLMIEKKPNHHLSTQLVNAPIPELKNSLKQIDKTPEIISRIKEIAGKGFSPSALTNYMRNPVDFYHKKILGLKEYDEVEETVAANTLGTVVHDTLEDFYKPLEGKIVTAAHINQMQSQIVQVVTRKFEATYKSGDIFQGQNLIIFNIAQQYVKNFLKQELALIEDGKQLKIIKIEANLTAHITIPELGFPVKIGGKVDRVDELDGQIRIIDYKTGKVEQRHVQLVIWEDLTTDYTKFSKSFQVLAYAYMMHNEKKFKQPIQAGIISFKNLQAGFLAFTQKETTHSKIKNNLIDQKTFDSYLIELKKLIIEICDIHTPFIEKEV